MKDQLRIIRNVLPVALCTGMLACAVAASAQIEKRVPVPAPPPAFHYAIDPTIVKEARTYHEVADRQEHAVAHVRDDKGSISSFVEDELVVRDDPAEVALLVSKYHAKVLRQITVNLMSPDGKPLGAAKTRPRTVLQLDATEAALALEDTLKKTDVRGAHTFTTQKSANLAAIMANEQAAGHAVQLNFLMHNTDFPTSTTEQADQNGVSNAFQWPEFDHRAWQYVIDMGIKTHPLVAIIDGGFWLNSNGVPCGIKVDSLCGPTAPPAPGVSDLPGSMLEGDATGGTGFAGGMNPANCTGGSPCPWHGNGTISVATAALNNKTGAAGTGAPAAIPFPIKVDMSVSEVVAAMEAAVSNGASVINISGGGSCNWWCRTWYNAGGNDTSEPQDALDQGVLVVAAAGNDAQDAGNEDFWPCMFSFCVGAVESFPDSHGFFTHTNDQLISYSNFGPSVGIYAPTNIHAMPNGSSNGQMAMHNGTSAAAPYVSGVAALMKAVNPSLTGSEIKTILVNTGVFDVAEIEVLQQGPKIQPFAAVMAANGNQQPKPEIHITFPKNGATVTQQFSAGQLQAWQGVQFNAAAADMQGGSWPIPVNSPFATGPITWKSSLDGVMTSELDSNGGTSMLFGFPASAKAGKRTITATATSNKGVSASDSIVVDYEPVFGLPTPAIVYPAANASLPAGTVEVRGTALSALGGYLPCSAIVWQKGIAATPIPSTAVSGGAQGVCGASVPFAALNNPKTLKMTATDTTGKTADAAEPLNITLVIKGGSTTTVGIDNPTPGAEFVVINGGPQAIPLHAFASNVPASTQLTYTWSWFQTGASPGTAKALGTGQSLTWNDSNVCGSVTIQVVATAPSIPAGQSPSASQAVSISCERIQ